MANRALFVRELPQAPAATAVNDAGGRAYELDPRHALALYAVTGTLHGTFYVRAEGHLARLQTLLAGLGEKDVPFVAKLAVYAAETGHMKDLPAFLLAWLMGKDQTGVFFAAAFPRVIKTGKMLSTWWQIVRSGAAGRTGLGSRPKRVVQRWFESQTPEFLFKTSIGVSDPGVADVLRVAHPRPSTPERRALYGYLSGRNRPEYAERAANKHAEPSRLELLPELVRQVEAFKKDPLGTPVPEVDFRLLSSFELTREHWTEIALRASWQTLRMNLSTFARHGVFESKSVRVPVFDPKKIASTRKKEPYMVPGEVRSSRDVVSQLAAKLRDPKLIERANVFPYQLLAAYSHAGADVPRELIEALHDAMELATANVPAIEGNVVVCLDVSRSMSSPITGNRGEGSTSAMRCVDVAALFAACVLRKNSSARLIPFEAKVVEPHRMPRIEPRDTIMTNAQKLAGLCGGGTNCASPLVLLNEERAQVDAVIYVSDNESWIDPEGRSNRFSAAYFGREMSATSTMQEWKQLVSRNPKARMICIDIQPGTTHQTAPDPRIMNVGGFSDEVFNIASMFLSGKLERGQWLSHIEGVDLG
jgi:60 kDa SS-A/Ro ribonucleoprotein